jgi:hypothetical protein
LVTHVGAENRRKWEKMGDNETFEMMIKRRRDEDNNWHDLSLEDLELTCFYPRGAIMERDCSCNSNIMLSYEFHREGNALEEVLDPEETSDVPKYGQCRWAWNRSSNKKV